MAKKITLYALSVALIATIYFVCKSKNIPFEKLTGDPAMVNDTNPLVGFLSNLGALLWCASCTICFFSASVIYKKQKDKDFNFLIYSGIFSLILLIDDFFMIHDYLIYYVAPYTFTQKIILIAYLLFAVLYTVIYFKYISSKNYIILGLAFVFLGLSLITDFVFDSGMLDSLKENKPNFGNLEYLIEDSFKFLGIVSWLLFFSTTSLNLLKSKIK